MPIVVAVSGPPGAGKTTLIHELLGRIPDSVAIHLDDYESYTRMSSTEIQAWMSSNGDPNDFDLCDLARDLQRLKQAPNDSHSKSTDGSISQNIIFFETLFGRQHHETGQWIDYQIWIDLPADLSLARNLQMVLRRVLADRPENHTAGAEWVYQYLDHYNGFVRELLLTQQQWIENQAEIVVDGTQDPATMSQQATELILLRCFP